MFHHAPTSHPPTSRARARFGSFVALLGPNELLTEPAHRPASRAADCSTGAAHTDGEGRHRRCIEQRNFDVGDGVEAGASRAASCGGGCWRCSSTSPRACSKAGISACPIGRDNRPSRRRTTLALASPPVPFLRFVPTVRRNHDGQRRRDARGRLMRCSQRCLALRITDECETRWILSRCILGNARW